MRPTASDTPQATPFVPEIADENFVRQTTARILITASDAKAAEALARRIHNASARARSPLVQARAIDFPGEPARLRETWSRLVDTAADGTLLISDVDQLAPAVQEQLLTLLEELEFGRTPGRGVRLMSSTTVSLPKRIDAGGFSARLFYRLNIIHLML
jgi:DNA-binding NtrC family response regulator